MLWLAGESKGAVARQCVRRDHPLSRQRSAAGEGGTVSERSESNGDG